MFLGQNNIATKGVDKIKINKKNFIFTLLVIMLLITISFTSFKTYAKNDEKYVVLGGDSIGLNLQTGVVITGKFDVLTSEGKCKPWDQSDIKTGDLIVSATTKKRHVIKSISDLKNVVKEAETKSITLEIKRMETNNSTFFETSVNIIKNDKNENSIGLYLKDNIVGVGTMTYYDIGKKTFGALGHAAVDIPVYSGTILKSYINGYTKGVRGLPGEKHAKINNETVGTVLCNNEFGIFGKLNHIQKDNELIAIADIKEIQEGKANLITVLEGDKKETFEINIVNVRNQEEEAIKGLKFEVTDERLLNKTGGIIQGMSGSPIVQNGKLIGAVSHVLVDDSKVGYGVFAEWMIRYS